MQKLYCYVDENGQETEGRIFIVSVVVLEKEKDELFDFCEQLEQSTGKGKFKWGKAEHSRRVAYLRRVFVDQRFKGNLRFRVFRGAVDQHEATIDAIARAVRFRKPAGRYTTLVYVDGLAKTKRHLYGNALRNNWGVPNKKVQGVTKDENNALVRLADSIAGFVRDVLDGDEGELRRLFEQARQRGVLVEL